MSADFRGRRIAFVTGASRGIGRASALALAEHGYALLVSGRDGAALSRTAEEAGIFGVPVRTCVADLESSPDLARVGAELAALETLDVMVHAAGLFVGGSEGRRQDSFERAFALHCTIPALLADHARPALAAARGLVVFMSSTQALRPSPGVGAYAASKAAVGALAESLRGEFGQLGIRVTTVVPGSTDTDMQTTVAATMNRQVDPAALMQPADVAAAVVFCAGLPANVEVPELVMRPMPPHTNPSPLRAS